MLTPATRRLKQANILFAWIFLIVVILGLVKGFGKGEIITAKSLEIEDMNLRGWKEGEEFFYEVFAKLKNPNKGVVAEKIQYLFEIKDKEGVSLVQIQEKGLCSKLKPEKECELKKTLTLQKVGETLYFQIGNIEWK